MAGFESKNVVVTGGAGFIGSHLVDALLVLGALRVAVVDTFFLGRSENLRSARESYDDALKVFREDAGDRGAMAAICDEIQPDVIFNLATKALLYSFFNPSGAFRTNTDIAETLAELLRAGAYGRLIHVSSSEVYGTAQTTPMNENHPLFPKTSYAAGKAAGDLMLASYVNMFDLDIVTVRPFNNFGPRQNDGALAAVVPLTIKRIRSGEQPVIYGDGLQTRDFIYVGDTVDGILRIAITKGLKGQILNFGSGRETAIKTVVEEICRIMNYTGEIAYEAVRSSDVRRHCAGVEPARAAIGKIAPTSLADGLAKTVAWYEIRG